MVAEMVSSMSKKEVNFRMVTLINNNFGSKSSVNPAYFKIILYFYRVFLNNMGNMESKGTGEEREISFRKPQKRRGWKGFPIWVWLVLLAVVAGVYIWLSLKYQ